MIIFLKVFLIFGMVVMVLSAIVLGIKISENDESEHRREEEAEHRRNIQLF